MTIRLQLNSLLTAWRPVFCDLEPFSCGTVELGGYQVRPWRPSPSGVRWDAAGSDPNFRGLPYYGYLDKAEALRLAVYEADYLIWSYQTVIGWHLGDQVYGTPKGGEWIITDSKFSQSTTRHQATLRNALAAATGGRK